jgi:outer membrane protein assembly factor BamD (BamD/ComL family)
LVYYNEAVDKDPNSRYAEEAKRRIEQINKLTTEQPGGN